MAQLTACLVQVVAACCLVLLESPRGGIDQAALLSQQLLQWSNGSSNPTDALQGVSRPQPRVHG